MRDWQTDLSGRPIGIVAMATRAGYYERRGQVEARLVNSATPARARVELTRLRAAAALLAGSPGAAERVLGGPQSRAGRGRQLRAPEQYRNAAGDLVERRYIGPSSFVDRVVEAGPRSRRRKPAAKRGYTSSEIAAFREGLRKALAPPTQADLAQAFRNGMARAMRDTN